MLLFKLNLFKCFLSSGKKTKCSMEMKEGSTDELEVTVKPIMKGRHALEIRIHDKVVFRKEVETIQGKCSINAVTF